MPAEAVEGEEAAEGEAPAARGRGVRGRRRRQRGGVRVVVGRWKVAVPLLALLISACGGGGPSIAPTDSTTPPSPTADGQPDWGSKPDFDRRADVDDRTDANIDGHRRGSFRDPGADAGGFARLERASEVGAGPSAREDHTWTVDGDGTTAYLFGGRDGGDISNELWSFDLRSDTWTIAAPSGPAPDARFGHTATWVPDVGLVIWSGQAGSSFFNDIWAYDPTTGAWRELPSLGDVPPARYGSCASLGPDGRLWISHGFTDTGRFDDTRAYDFATGEWTDETPDGDLPDPALPARLLLVE